MFAKVCFQCHTLFGTGGKVGPDLTGSNRGDLDYILQNMVDPNAVIPNDYLAWNIDTKDDRTITGVMREQTDLAITVATANETLTLPAAVTAGTAALGGSERALGADDLEVAVLSRSNGRRCFRRMTDADVAEILAG